MSNQLQITGGAKVRDLNGVITGSTGVLSSLPINGANGIPQLDSSGKILVSQLPNSVMEFLGTWNAATNTPTLVNGTGNAGDVYLCTVAGTVDFGAGPITFQDGDYVVYSGSTWERSSGAMGTVTSVGASITGNSIGITGSPVTTAGTLAFAFAGTSGQYINGAGNLVTFPSLGGFVPYSGATGNVNLGEWGITSGYLGFDTTPTGTPTTQGTMYWDASRQTVALIMDGTTQKIGQDSFFYVKNSSGSTIPKGTGVRFAGTDGASGHILIAPFLANGTYPSTYFMGITAEAIPNGSFGQVVNFGEIGGIDTTGFAAGDLLYASTTVAGGFQTTVPTAPNNIVLVAATLNSKSNGDLIVRPTFGSNINNDEGVLITTPSNNQGLFYDSASGLWKNKTIATALGYTPITLASLSATSPLIYNNATGNFSIQAANVSQSGYLTATDWNRFDIAYTNRITSANSPLSITSNTISISQATTSTNGYLSSTDWNTFNSKQNALTLTTTGSSGASTLVGATLNIPTYTLSGLGGVPTSRTLTINGTTYDLSADRTWTINSMVYPSAGIAVSTGTAWGTSIVDNSSNWNTAYSLRISSATAPLSISSNVISISQASSTTNGYLSSTDWNTFNNKQGQFSLTAGKVPFAVGSSSLGDTSLNYNGGNFGFGTAASTYRIDVSGSVNVTGNYYVNGVAVTTGGVTGTGTTNYLPKFTGTSTIGNSGVYDNGGSIQLLNDNYVYGNGTAGSGTIKAGIRFNGTAQELKFFTADIGRMLLDASGNLGLGVTPSAWNTNYKAFEVGAIGSGFMSKSGEANLYINANAYYDNGGTWRYGYTDLASAYQQFGGMHKWLTAPSGTAGNPITFTQAMTLTASGKLLLGTTTEDTYKLDVNGTGRFSGNVSTNGAFIYQNNATQCTFEQTYSGANPLHTSLTTYNGTYYSYDETNARYIIKYTASSNTLNFYQAATFSSSVTAGNGTFVGDTETLRLYTPINTGYTSLKIMNDLVSTSRMFEIKYYGSGSSTGESAWLGTIGGAPITFATTNTPRLHIAAGGNVGIGTTSPGAYILALDYNASSAAVMSIKNSSASGYSGAHLLNNSGTLMGHFGYANASTGAPLTDAVYFGSIAAKSVIFTTSDTEKMRITSGGVVQIANASGTQGTLVGSERLNVNGGIYAYDTIKSTNVFHSVNGFMNSYESYNAWELGNAFSTSGLTLKTTSYVTVRINGSVYKLATVN